MMFVQGSAGNAQRRSPLRLGAAASPTSRSMPSRSLATIVALTLALALPVASAHASDPLLSGYGGPGGGEQVVLGGNTVKPPKSSSSAQDPATASLKAGTGSETSSPASGTSASGGSGASSGLTRKPQRKKSSSSSSKDRGDDGDQGTTTTTATLPGAPEVVAYPTRTGDVGGLPVSAPGVLLVVLGVVAAMLVGLGLRRLCGFDRGSDPQVSGP
jgi:hypothetical protein